MAEEVQRRSGLIADGEGSWELVVESLWRVVVVLMQTKGWPRPFVFIYRRTSAPAASCSMALRCQC